MILSVAAAVFLACLVVWSMRYVDRARGRRVVRWTLFALGVITALVLILEVAINRPAFPIVLVVAGLAWAVVMLTLWVVADVHDSPAERWADAHGVTLVEANREFVQRYLSEGHRLRLVCGLGGAVAIAALGRGIGVGAPVSGWAWLMLGYLVGVIWSEAWLTRLPAGTRRAASLKPRRVGDYLAGRLRIAQLLVPIAAVILGVVAFAGGTDAAVASRWTVVAIGVAVCLLAVGIAMLQHHIVTKPQPDAELPLVVADDAVRASSVHLLSGTGLGIMLVCIAAQLDSLRAMGVLGDGGAGLGSLVCAIAALLAWRYYGHRGWVVRRSRRSAVLERPVGGVRT